MLEAWYFGMKRTHSPTSTPPRRVARDTGGSSSAEPIWANSIGAKRIIKEYEYMQSLGEDSPVSNIVIDDANIFKWRFQMKNFDNDNEGGRRLNEQLGLLNAMHGQDHIVMEAVFPEDYPNSPFSVRVITPRMVWYTGHVTAGGSICLESLTNSGTPGKED